MNKTSKKALWAVGIGLFILALIAVYITGMSENKIRKTTNYSLWFVQRDTSDGVFGYADYAYTLPNTTPQADTALYRSILTRLTAQPEKTALCSVFPPNTEIRTVYINGTTLRINFSSEFSDMSEHEKTLAKYCIAKTFSVFENISEISISVEGKPLAKNGIYSIESYVTEHSHLSETSTEITFYRLAPNRHSLSAEREEVTWYRHNSLPRLVTEDLLKDYAGGVIPQGTRLVYIYQKEATVYLGLSPEFGSINGERGALAMYSIVNTLSSIPDVAYVVVSLGGEMSSIADIPLDKPLLPNMTYVYNE